MDVNTTSRTTVPPCPPWCGPQLHEDDHVGAAHYSSPQTWEESTDFPRIEVCYYRGDEHEQSFVSYPKNIGMTALDITFTGIRGCSIEVDDDDNPILTGYFLTANEIRSLARWLLNLAEQIDPHNLNGEPLEWHRRNERRP